MKTHVIVQGRAVYRGVDAACLNQSRQGRGEPQGTLRLGNIERLDAEPITREDNPAGITFVNGESEHAKKTRYTAFAPCMPCLENDFCVTVGEELVALLFQLCAQFAEIIDAAIEHKRQTEVGVDHRLLRFFRKIKDSQSSMPEADIAPDHNPGCIGPARTEYIRHFRDCRN